VLPTTFSHKTTSVKSVALLNPDQTSQFILFSRRGHNKKHFSLDFQELS